MKDDFIGSSVECGVEQWIGDTVQGKKWTVEVLDDGRKTGDLLF